MAKTAKQLREERADLIKQAQKLNTEKADPDTGLLAAEDQATFDNMLSDATSMADQAKRLESLDEAFAQLDEPLRPGLTPEPGATPKAKGQAGDQFIFVRGSDTPRNGEVKYEKVAAGSRGSSDYASAFATYVGGRTLSTEQHAAMQSDDSEAGGYLVASEQFASEMLKEVDDLVFVRQYAKVHTVREADALGIRKRNQRLRTFGWSEELTVSAADTSLKFGKRVLTPHHLTGQAEVSRDLMKRSTMSPDQILRQEMSRDAAEVMEDGFLTGTGDKQPLGVFTPSSEGISTTRDVATGSTTGVTSDGLVKAKYALKSQYRKGSKGSLRWLFHRDAITQVALLKDNDGHYMFRPGQGNTGEEPDRLLNIPVDESERTPNTFTDGNYFGLLANWRYYEIADALDMEIQILTELSARTNKIVYIGRLKCDGMATLEEAFVRLKCAA